VTRPGATSLPEVRLLESGDVAIRLDVGYVAISADGDVTVLDPSEMPDEAPRLLPALPETPIRASVRAELGRAIDFFRWCWDCGSTDSYCRALGPGRKCCPDCRHRDTGHTVLGRVLAPPAGARCTATAVPGWLLGKGELSCTEEAGHAPPHVDPDGATWTEIPDRPTGGADSSQAVAEVVAAWRATHQDSMRNGLPRLAAALDRLDPPSTAPADDGPVGFVDEEAEALMMIASMVGVSTNAEPREVIAGVQARLGAHRG
jgi:hypothetical protein